MNNGPTVIPSVTPGERSFLYHFNAETFQGRRGPAIEWLDGQGLDWSHMAVFQRWGARHDQRSVLGIDDEPLPPFEVPWASRQEFLARVQDLLKSYPDLKLLMRPRAEAGASA